MRNNSSLIITGGWAHDFETWSVVLTELIQEVGLHVDIASDVAESEVLMNKKLYDLILVYACWFKMEDQRYSSENRAQWSRTTSASWRNALLAQRKQGAGLLALHTAVICFDDSPEWTDWVGGSWEWGVSHHPQPCEVHIEPVIEHPIVYQVQPFIVFDEQYINISRAESTTVLTQSIGLSDPQASMWIKEADGSRSVYSALGHDERSFTHPTHKQLIQRSAMWAAGASDDEVKAIGILGYDL